MYDTIYVETEVRHLPQTKRILSRYSSADIIICNRYSEIFNRKAQDFRIQKQHPSLILARKHDGFVLRTPDGYGVGGTQNYYFSIMLNCLYDCRYCFLQGMYRSAHHVIFVNYEDFESAIDSVMLRHENSDEIWFFSGYDCDSLAMEPVAGFGGYFIDALQSRTNAWLELRTKSTQIRSLLEREADPTVVTAFSVTPEEISKHLEYKVPHIDKRIAAMVRLQSKGWKIGLRFDPLIFSPDYQVQYGELIEKLFSNLNFDLLHSISIGVFRLPRDFYRNMERQYPDNPFIAQPFEHRNGQVSYPVHIESEMTNWCYSQLVRHIDKDRIFFATIEGLAA